MAEKDGAYWAEKLDMTPHPEGGWYKETYRASETIPHSALPIRFEGSRSMATSIYFLLNSGDVSHLHRLKSDEVWHFHKGTSLTLYIIHPDGSLETQTIGPEGPFQTVVPHGVWFGAAVDAPDSFTLVGCGMAPGFDFADFEMGDRETLLAEYPAHKEVILKLT